MICLNSAGGLARSEVEIGGREGISLPDFDGKSRSLVIVSALAPLGDGFVAQQKVNPAPREPHQP